MKITFSPIRSDTVLKLRRIGDALYFNETEIDLAQVALSGPEVVVCGWIVGPVSREAGQISLTVLLPHGAQAQPDALFPAAVEVHEDGEIDLPDYGL